MVKSKADGILNLLVVTFLLVYPFGQLLRYELFLFDTVIILLPIDLIVVISALIRLFINKNIHRNNYFVTLVSTLFFGLFLSLGIFQITEITKGIMYLIRLISYFVFTGLIQDLLVNKSDRKKRYLNLLMVGCVIIAAVGWLGYLFIPDMRFNVIYGWDDHLFRLVSVFFDPGFTAMIFSLGAILSLDRFNASGNKGFLALFVFLSGSLLVTYSRAGYLSYCVGITYLTLIRKQRIYLICILITFCLFVLFGPKGLSEGTNLFRTSSLEQRITNYHQAILIWTKSPLFGVGYNNYCQSRNKYLGDNNTMSHSCSGSDSSILLLLATTGVAGVLIILNLFIKFLSHLWHNPAGTTVTASIIALAINSLFINSLFYPWIMGWMAIIIGSFLAGEFTSKNEA